MRSKLVKNILDKYGSNVQLISYEDGVELIESGKAFIQPLRYKSSSMENEFFNPGYVDKSRYMYIGDPSLRLDLKPFNSILTCEDKNYIIKKSKCISMGNEIIYIWAILQEAYIEN